MRHFVESISSHPRTPLLKRLTWSMPMFSGTWTRLYQKQVITSPQGQYFAYQNPDILSHRASSEKQLLCMARAILIKSKILVMDEVGILLSMSHLTLVTDSDKIIRRLLGLNMLNLPVVYQLRMTIYSVDYATDELIGKTIRQ